MSLSELHAEHLANLTGEAQVDYLLNCLDYLVADDVSGWKMRDTERSPSGARKFASHVRWQRRRLAKHRRIKSGVCAEEVVLVDTVASSSL